MRATPIKMHPGAVPYHFAYGPDGLKRRLADGTYKPIRALNGGRVMAVHEGERIYGIDIAWCLRYGNWPKYPLANVDGNPFNLGPDNIFPARLGAIRYRETVKKDGKYYHPLSDTPFNSSERCRKAWNYAAADRYRDDLSYVLEEEERERKLRLASDPTPPDSRRRSQRIPVSQKPRVAMPPRPKAIEGRVWHFHAKKWLSVPQPVHVADDYRIRCLKVLKGAVRFEYMPDYEEVWGFDHKGQVVVL